MPNPHSIQLYRRLLRALKDAEAPLPGPVARKLAFNIRQLFDFYRGASVNTTHDLHDDGAAALRLLRWLRTLPEVGGRDQERQPDPAPRQGASWAPAANRLCRRSPSARCHPACLGLLADTPLQCCCNTAGARHRALQALQVGAQLRPWRQPRCRRRPRPAPPPRRRRCWGPASSAS